MARRRDKHLVPEGAVEQFEVRIVAYFDADARVWVAVELTTPDPDDETPHEHEVLGVIAKAVRDNIPDLYPRDDEDDEGPP